jgi:Tfp pilus assembly protein PilF
MHTDGKRRIELLCAQLGGPRDGALLRYSLGAALLEAGDTADAIAQLRAAIDFDGNYSAAWKLLGNAYLQSSDTPAAADAWEHGIAVAEARGDVQAAKEMRVFLKRLERGR